MHHTRLEVYSATGLEVTVTSTVADAVAASVAVANHIRSVAEPLDADTPSLHRLPATVVDETGGDALATGAGCYQLCNLTGREIEVWLAAMMPDGSTPRKTPRGPADMVVLSSAVVSLPVLDSHMSEISGRRVGRPSRDLGVILEDSSSSMPTSVEEPVQNQQQPGPEEKPRRNVMYFRLAGVGRQVGPVRLDRQVNIYIYACNNTEYIQKTLKKTLNMHACNNTVYIQ